jgi:L-fuculose-phosphate aldolase
MQNVHKLKQDMCDIGRRIYNRQFAAANDGNITVRVSDNEVLCTPTLHCKGFLKPDDIAMVDMTGKQIAGRKKRSSEALLHLEIYRQREDIKSIVHCHPPHATAFAIAREPIPQCVLPEVEVFLGDVPITKYETPGGQDFADTIIPFVQRTNVIILAKQLGNVSFLSGQKSQELLDLKETWGFKDARNTPEYENCDICANDIFRDSWAEAGVERRAFPSPPPLKSSAASDAPEGVDEEALVKLITDEVVRQLQHK